MILTHWCYVFLLFVFYLKHFLDILTDWHKFNDPAAPLEFFDKDVRITVS